MDSKDANHECTAIRIHVKAVTGIPKSHSKRGLGKPREYYVSVNVDNETRETGIQRNIGSLEWDEFLLLSADKSSVITFQLHAKHTFQVKCVGKFQEKLVDLMASVGNPDKHGSFLTRPLINGSKRGSEGNILITFAVEVEVYENELDKDNFRRANKNLPHLEHTALLESVNDLADVMLASGTVDKAKRTTDPWKPFLRRVKLFVELVDKVAEVHPYAKMAWSVLSFAYKVCASQLERDRNITNLLEAMNEAYAFMVEAKCAEEILPQKQILERLAQQTIDCAYFISSYSKDTSFIKRAGKHAISITADDAVAEYKAKFAEILDAFNRQAVLQTEIATFGIVKGVSDLAQDLDLMDMPYADGARYQRRKQCLIGTRVDILDEISKWITDMDDKRRICILTGAAGVGKSSIAHTLARRFEDIQRLGSSFCFSKDQANRTPDLLIPTLIRDLAGFDPLVKTALSHIVHNRPSLRKTQDFEDQFENIFLKAITSLSVTGPVFISIDALDESGDVHARREFLSVLIQNINRLPSNMRIFFTSRAENDILELFQDNSDILFLSMKDSATSTDDDILVYIRARLVDARGRPFPGLDENHYKTLADKAEGLFQWASVACNVIVGDGKAGSNPLARYDKLLSSLGFSAPPLDSLYKAVLSHLFDTKEDDMCLFTRVMGLVLTAYEPLSIATLDKYWKRLGPETVCGNPDGIRSVLKYMGSLLSGIYTENEGVRPLHTSFRDFLTDPVRSGAFCIDISASHTRLSVACLGVLNTDLRFNICHLESSYLQNSHIADLSVRIQRYVPTHLSYACRFWGKHLGEATSLDTINPDLVTASHQHLESFLHGHLLHWFEVLSLIKAVNVVHSSLSAAILHIKEEDGDLAALATDAQKFIRMFGGLISDCCPHIYLSALPCTPPTSRLYKRYHQLFRNSAFVVNGAMPGWPKLQNVIDNKNMVFCVAFSPGGLLIASGSYDSIIRIWDAETCAIVGPSLEGHTASVQSVAFSPDGKRIVSGSSDNTIRIWDIETGAAVGATLEGHTDWVNSVAFSPDGNHIVSGSSDNTIRLWDANTYKAIGAPLEGHTDYVQSVSFSPDGHRIVSGSFDCTIRMWDADTGEAMGGPLEGHTDSVQSVSFSPDLNRIVSSSSDKTIRIWDADTGKAVGKPLEGHTDSILSVAFSPDGHRIVSGSFDKTIRFWDANTGAAMGSPLGDYRHSVLSVAFSPDGNRIVSGSPDETIRIWDADTRSALGAPFEGHTHLVRSVAFSSDGNRIVSGSYDKTIRIWDSETGTALRAPLEGHTLSIQSIAVSPDGNRIVSGSFDKTIRIWDTDTGALIGSPLKGHTDLVYSVAFSPDGKRIVSGSSDKTVRIWGVDTGSAVRAPLEGHTHSVWSVAYSPSGNRVVSGSCDKTIRIWDVETGSSVGAPLEGHTDYVHSVAFSANGSRIVSGSSDKTIRIWDADTGAALGAPFEGHSNPVLSVAFSPDQSRIASGSSGHTIRIWDADTGLAVGAPLVGHTDSVLSVAFSPDSNRIVSGSSDNTIRIWSIDASNTTAGGVQRLQIQSTADFGRNNDTDDSDPNLIQNVTSGRTFDTSFTTIQNCQSSSVLFSSSREHALHFDDLHLNSLGNITYSPDSGWVLGSIDELIFYVPPHFRKGLIVPHNFAICGVQPVEIDFSRFVHGTSWSDCHTPVFL